LLKEVLIFNNSFLLGARRGNSTERAVERTVIVSRLGPFIGDMIIGPFIGDMINNTKWSANVS